jgi:hypothetical protein
MSSKRIEIFKKKASNQIKKVLNSQKISLKCHAFLKKSLKFSKKNQAIATMASPSLFIVVQYLKKTFPFLQLCDEKKLLFLKFYVASTLNLFFKVACFYIKISNIFLIATSCICLYCSI